MRVDAAARGACDREDRSSGSPRRLHYAAAPAGAGAAGRGRRTRRSGAVQACAGAGRAAVGERRGERAGEGDGGGARRASGAAGGPRARPAGGPGRGALPGSSRASRAAAGLPSRTRASTSGERGPAHGRRAPGEAELDPQDSGHRGPRQDEQAQLVGGARSPAERAPTAPRGAPARRGARETRGRATAPRSRAPCGGSCEARPVTQQRHERRRVQRDEPRGLGIEAPGEPRRPPPTASSPRTTASASAVHVDGAAAKASSGRRASHRPGPRAVAAGPRVARRAAARIASATHAAPAVGRLGELQGHAGRERDARPRADAGPVGDRQQPARASPRARRSARRSTRVRAAHARARRAAPARREPDAQRDLADAVRLGRRARGIGADPAAGSRDLRQRPRIDAHGPRRRLAARDVRAHELEPIAARPRAISVATAPSSTAPVSARMGCGASGAAGKSRSVCAPRRSRPWRPATTT